MADSNPSAAAAAEPPPGKTSREALVDLARSESEQVAKVRAVQHDFAQRGERLSVDVPLCFFQLCAGLREAVQRFNDNLTETPPELPLRWRETPAVTLREAGSGQELLVSVWRRSSHFDLVLRYMSRANKPDLPVIEGHGVYGMNRIQRALLRVEGWVEKGQTIYWVSLDFKRYPIRLEELPDRIAMSVVRSDPGFLGRELNPPPPPPRET